VNSIILRLVAEEAGDDDGGDVGGVGTAVANTHHSQKMGSEKMKKGKQGLELEKENGRGLGRWCIKKERE